MTVASLGSPMGGRILLLSHSAHWAHRLRQALTQGGTDRWGLDWRSPLDWMGETWDWSSLYQVCVVDDRGLPPLPPDPDLLGVLGQWQKQLGGLPLILLTGDRQLGEWAVTAGIEDYWLTSDLTPDTIHRSLRLLWRIPRQCKALDDPTCSLYTLPPGGLGLTFYQSLLEDHPYGLLGLDKCGRIIFANGQCRSLLDLQGTYLGKPLEEAWLHPLAAQWMNDHAWLLRTQKSLEQVEILHSPLFPYPLTLATVKKPILSGPGKILGTQVIFNEVTEDQKLRDRLHLLQTLLGEIDPQDDFTQALGIILQRICDHTGWQYGEVWIPQRSGDGSQEVLTLSQAWYCNAPELTRYYEESKAFTFLLGEGLPGRIWSTGQPEWIENVTQGDTLQHFLRRDLAQDLELKGALGVPLVIHGRVMAVMVFFSRYLGTNDPSLVEMVTAIANQLARLLAHKTMEVPPCPHDGKMGIKTGAEKDLNRPQSTDHPT